MTANEILQNMEAMGSEQTRKIYGKHGVRGAMFGVSYANFGKLAKKIKTNHPLAQELWRTDNHDARILALMIADPNADDGVLAEEWMHDVSTAGNYVLTNALAMYMAATPLARLKADQWSASDDEWRGRTGWLLLAYIAKNETMLDAALTDTYFEAYLSTIEREIHTRKNRTRDAMNSALIGIGVRNEYLHEQALAVAKAIGKVQVDHGETNCKTPDAAAYIQKTLQHRQNKEIAKG